MCIIIHKPKGKQFNKEHIEKAYEFNKDGFGIMYFDELNSNVVVEKGLDLFTSDFFLTLDNYDDKEAVLHLRNNTVGTTTLENCHPFPVGDGSYFMHNGTINSFKPTFGDTSDSLELSNAISSIIATTGAEILENEGMISLLQAIAGTSINRLVFMDNQGKVHIVNPQLGIDEDGIWYSNDYYKREPYKPINSYGSWNKTDDEIDFVFVYGTLKKGQSNHRLLEKSDFIGDAKSLTKFAMVGKGLPFPYCVEKDNINGKFIKGEVYQVDKPTMDKLDALEGYPYFYDREVFWFDTDKGVKRAWIYTCDSIPYTPEECIAEWAR